LKNTPAFITLFLFAALRMDAVTDTLPSGSFIINMGVTPQTYKNGLKPYGLIYDLTVNQLVPVKWIINPGKAHEGIDFTYNGVDYKGGTFAIDASYRNTAVDSTTAAWQARGVVGVFTTSPVEVPTYMEITTFPNLVIDQQSASLITPYFDSAGIPSSSYRIGLPSDLDRCDDLYAMPHADPTWATHKNLYDFVVNKGGYFWASCHAVSVLESLKDPNPPYTQLNFLTEDGMQCYKNGKCGWVPESHNKTATRPYTYLSGYGAAPIMQFMGTMDSATENGSEEWYIPLSTGKWLNTTQRPLITSDGVSPNEGVKIAYGYAYGDSSNGMVMYEAGHRHTVGPVDDQVAAQRAFFNFLLLSIRDKALSINGNVAAQINSGNDTTFSSTVSGGSSPYTYSWSASCGGTFSNPNDSVTTFTPDTVWIQTQCVITLQVTDACGRSNIDTWIITINPPQVLLPIGLKEISASLKDGIATVKWSTDMEVNNDHFEVERKHEQESAFSTIGQVQGTGTNLNGASYSFDDDVSMLPDGYIYYRVKQVDISGEYGYSPQVSLWLVRKMGDMVVIYPNPLAGSVELQISLPSGQDDEAEIMLLDMQGKVVRSEEYKHIIAGNNQLSFYIPDVQSGIYLLRIKLSNSVINRQLVIHRGG